jgi:argininosuccinate lyase
MSKHLWSGRLSDSLDGEFAQFQSSLRFDRRLAHYDIEVSIAHAQMIRDQGMITPSEGEQILDALREIAADKVDEIKAGAFTGEDIHTVIESLIRDKIGAIAGKLHTARSRNDQVATDLRLFIKDACRSHRIEIRNLRLQILREAERHLTSRDGHPAILPGYTHLQIAQPLHLSHWFMAFFEALSRDESRFKEAYKRMDQCPLGAAALCGTSWPIDRMFTAKRLGFSEPMRNSVDAVASRDFVTDYLYASSSLMTTLSRMAEDLILYSTGEFGFVQMPDELSTGSSIMPQKKNPDLCELTRGKTGRVFGHLMGTLTVLKALPTAYNKDLQEDKEAVFGVFDTVHPLLRLWARLVPKLQWDTEQMYERTQEGFSCATELADELSRCGVPFREAHHIVGRLVQFCISRGKSLVELKSTELIAFHPFLTEQLMERMTVASVVEGRKSFGGSSMSLIVQAIKNARKQLNSRPDQAESFPRNR